MSRKKISLKRVAKCGATSDVTSNYERNVGSHTGQRPEFFALLLKHRSSCGARLPRGEPKVLRGRSCGFARFRQAIIDWRISTKAKIRSPCETSCMDS